MDAQSSGQHRHHGLGSWHPAMRPNAHEARQGESQQAIEAFPVSTTYDRAADEVTQPPQVAFRSRNGSPQQPISPSGRMIYSQNVDEAVSSSGGSDGETIKSDEKGICVNGAEGSSGNAVEVGMDQADSTGSLRTSEESAILVIQDVGQQTSSVVDDHVTEALGNKKEMDRVWELEEKELPSNIVANVNRTNSFPVVPPLRESKLVPPHSLPLSEVEEIIEYDETAKASDDGLSKDSFPPVPADINAPQDLFRAMAEDGSDDYFANSPSGQAQAITMIGEAEEESRYDEGLPLMQSLRPQPPSLSEGEDNNAEAQTHDIVNENDFFDKLSTDPIDEISAFKPTTLGRKSTAQVLNSIHYAPHSTTHHEPQSVEDTSSLADMTGGGVAVSAQAVKSQVLSEQQNDPYDSKPKDEDLAKLWKAALGDDDLLEEDEDPVDPSGFFDDDGEGFLEGSQILTEGYEPNPAISPPASESLHYSNGEMRGFRGINSRPEVPQNKYLPATPSQPTPFQQTLQGRSLPSNIASASTGFIDAVRQPSYGSQAPARPSMPASTQSFADKSKGGYTSPYDLPMDVTRPKKRNTFQQTNPNTDVQPTSSRAPPPRSSSMFTGSVPSIKSQPPVPRLPNAYSSTSNGSDAPPPLKLSPSMGSFFEELKPSSRTRPSSSMGRFAPPVNQPTPPPPVSSQREILRQSSLSQPPAHEPTESLQPYQLLPPERMSLYGNGIQAEPAGQTVRAVNARYSPAPVHKHNAPPPNNRYAASPSTGNRPPPTQALPFQPRTSSPLAQGDTPALQHQRGSTSDPSLRRPLSSGGQGSSAQNAGAPSFHQAGHQTLQSIDRSACKSEGTRPMAALSQSRQSLPPAQHVLGSNVTSDLSYHATESASHGSVPDKQASFQQTRELSSYAPVTSSHGPLRRSQTSSPGAGKYMPGAASAQPYQRPASVNQQMPSLSAEAKLPFSDPARPHSVSKDLNYIKPTDGRELDPLERWKGSPIFSFGFGGAIVTSFPAKVPRYAAGQAAPLIKCSPGEIRVQDGKILPLEDDIAAFPGPLRSKGKKKDVLEWLQRQISKMEHSGEAFASGVTLPDPNKNLEEKIILWKIMQVFVENDGAIDGNLSAEKVVRSILSPELTQGDSALPSQNSNASLVGISRHSGSRAIPDAASPDAMEGLRRLLLLGEREKAVWHAVDHRLWAHAMLLSSTLDKNIWKQVSQEFVRQEVKTFGNNTEALAALYQIFAGNGDDSADELVPPSARAGLQMVSKTASTGPTKNALDGLDRWREALTLIVSNRTPDDGIALVNLGRLLANYGRTEAAHTCYIFAKLPGLFGGPDDPQASVALLGADHIRHPFDYGRDLDSILLSEVYDFSRTVLASSSTTTVSPHLQSFKLYHAMILAEYGYKSEAQQYCEVITSTLNSTTKRSPYYHNLLLGALDNLVERLRQAPKDSSASWISKPSIDKVSGSLWAKFNQYVAGEDSDAASTGSGKGRDPAAGPFAGVTGDSPTLSRAPSSSDLYNSYAQGPIMHPPAPMAHSSVSRYAPASSYTPRSSFEQKGRPTQDLQRPAHADTLRPALPQQHYQSRPTSSTSSQQESYKPAPPATYPVRTESYLPTPPSQPQYMPQPPPEEHSSSLYQQDPYQPIPPAETQVLEDLHQRQFEHEASSGHQPPSSANIPASFAYEAPSTNDYEPTSSSGYDPPSYNSEPPLTEEPALEEKPKKRSFMDDDEDDFEARAAALRKEEKARKDREADEAFRRAAEADSQKDKAQKPNAKKSGWFGGWLGGKKEGEEVHGTPNAPIKAKLGEQSSFYYDAEKKRWIDKKNPDATLAATATPPPPKGPPSRAVSASAPPPPSTAATPPVPPLPTLTATSPITFTKTPISDPPSSSAPSQHPSRNPSPAMNANNAQANETPASGPASGPPLAPPSRPATAMSGASSIDDLIGIPQARKGGTIKKAKKKGYVDVMAK